MSKIMLKKCSSVGLGPEFWRCSFLNFKFSNVCYFEIHDFKVHVFWVKGFMIHCLNPGFNGSFPEQYWRYGIPPNYFLKLWSYKI